MRKLERLLLIALVVELSACGGGSGDEPASVPSHGTGILQGNAYVLSAEQAAGSTLTLQTLTVRKPQSRRFVPGDVVILDAHEGRLLKITSVAESADTVTYQYTLASLAQAFRKLDVSFSGELTPQELGDNIQTDDPSLEVTWVTREDVSARADTRTAQQVKTQSHLLQIRYKNYAGQVGSGVELDGTSTFALNPDFSLRLEPVNGQELPSLEMSALVAPELSTSVSISSLYGGQVSFTVDKSIPLPAFKRYILVPIFGVPTPVPFWVKPVLTLSGSVNGTAGSKFTTTKTFGVSGTLGFRRTAANGLEAVANHTITSDMNVRGAESELGVNMSVPKLELHFQIYSVAGPTIDAALESSLKGVSTVAGVPALEGVKVTAAANLVVNAGLKASLDFKHIDGVKALLGDVSVEYTPFALNIAEQEIAKKEWFFPYQGIASIHVTDQYMNDDIFEVALDGVVLGRTRKGGSGQFRLKNLRPGVRVLKLTTIQDDNPPGTFAITLANGLTFVGGESYRVGTAALGTSVQFDVVVP